MRSDINISEEVTGKLLYRNRGEIVNQIKKISRNIMILCVCGAVASIMLFFITLSPYYLILSSVLFFLAVLALMGFRSARNVFEIYENGFVTGMGIRPDNSKRISEYDIGLKYVPYTEIKSIYKVKNESPYFRDFIRIDIEHPKYNYSTILPGNYENQILTKLLPHVSKTIVQEELYKVLTKECKERT